MKNTEILINYSKCIAPQDCRKCLEICQPAVLVLTFVDNDFHAPENWRIVPAFPKLCIKCDECTLICPENAITIS